jgi:alanine-synthesizing transaminase
MFSRRTSWPRHENALARRAAGVIDLTVSNPTICGLSPVGITLPVVDQYEPDSLGLISARQAVAQFIGTSPEQIVLCSSTSEAYEWIFKLLCDPGDEVLVPAPSYPLLEFFDVKLGRYVEQPAFSERTRAVVAISPGNPLGKYLSDDECEQLAQLCAQHHCALIIDEVFASPARSAARRDWPCLTFVLGGLSKSVGLPQLKLAWSAVLGPQRDEAIERLALIADTFLSVNSPVQVALPKLLELAPAFRARVAQRCAENRASLRLPPEWQLISGDAGWTAVIRVPQSPDEETRCLQALDRGVAVHPGYFYDFPSGAHLVISLLPQPEIFREGARRLYEPSR